MRYGVGKNKIYVLYCFFVGKFFLKKKIMENNIYNIRYFY